MSSEEADTLMENLEKKWSARNREAFMHRMERKLNRRDKTGKYSSF